MVSRYGPAAVVLLGILGASTIQAHHSSAPHFDRNKPIEISGVVTKFRFVNPHAYLYLDVTDENGEVATWNCEMAAASSLRRSGWTNELFAPGTRVAIKGSAARRDPQGCSFEMGTLDDGTTIARNGPITRGGDSSVARTSREAPAADSYSDTLAGTWITTPRQRTGRPAGPPGGGADRFAGMITTAGAAALADYDMRFDDPALHCSPSSIIRGWGEPNSVSEIFVSDTEVIIKHEYMDTVRVVDLTTREHPASITPSLTGHSVGWYEDKTLVIETTGFSAGILLPHPGLMHSDKMRVVERLTLSDDSTSLTREYEVTDPDYLKTPFTGQSGWTRTDIPLREYNCTELSGINNQRQ